MASPAIFKGKLTKFLTNGGILIPARPQSTDASVVPTPGELAYDTENENFVVYQDGAWEVVAVFSDLIATNIVNTPYGTITAVNVQTALNELSDEKVQKAGDAMTGNLTFANNTGIESTVDVSTLNIGTTSFAHNVNIGTGSHTSSVNIGTGTGITTINIGGAGDTINIGGELVYVQVSDLQVQDKQIIVNVNGAAGSGDSAGLHVEEGGVITGLNHVANSRQSWELVAPANPGAVWITPSVGAFVTEIEASSTANRTLTLPDTTDTLATQTQIDDLNDRIDDLTTDDVPESITPTNLYFTDTRAKTAAVVNSVAGNQTDQAPSVSSIVSYVNSEINALDTDDIEEGLTNKYFTDERAQDAAWNALDAGTNGAGGAISVQYDDALNKLALVIGNASTTVRGAALFNPFDFDLDAQQRIVIKDGGVNNTQLENSSVTLNGTSVSLGGSSFVGIVNANKSTAGNLEANTRVFVDTSASAFALTLPPGAANAYVELKDAKGTWDTNNLTVLPATGEKINGFAINESIVCDVRDGWLSFAWDVTNSRWNLSTTAAINLNDIEASVTQPGIVSTTNQSFAGVKTFTDGIILTPETTPLTPPSAGLQVYAKADNKLYTLTSAGVEQAVGSGGSIVMVTQASHGFVAADIGRPLYLNGSTYALAQADTETKAEVAGLINRIIDTNTFEVCLGGEVSSIGVNVNNPIAFFDSYTGFTPAELAYLPGPDSTTPSYVASTFDVPTTKSIPSVKIYIKTPATLVAGSGIYVEIYARDSGNEPTGTVLATSNTLLFSSYPVATDILAEFTFSSLTLNGGQYIWVLKAVNTAPSAISMNTRSSFTPPTIGKVFDGSFSLWGTLIGKYYMFQVLEVQSPPLTAGEVYYLSATSAGKLTTSAPSVVGQISKPVGIARTSTALDFFNMRGNSVGGSNVYTQISLANNATTTIQNAAAYDSVELAGWVYINATAKYRFHFKAQVTKKGDATDYLVSFQTSGDTPPAGFNITVTTAGLVQVVMPSVVGFSSALVQFSLNGPAIGASLPLQIESDKINIVDSAPLSYRNRVINGNFDIWQRGTSAAPAPNVVTGGYGAADRWKYVGHESGVTYAAVTMTRVTDAPAGSRYAAKMVSTAAGLDDVCVAQYIEASNCYDLVGQSVTLSFWAKRIGGLNGSSLFVEVLSLATVDTGATGNIYTTTLPPGTTSIQNITLTNAQFSTSWTKYTMTIPSMPAATANGLMIRFVVDGTDLGSGDLFSLAQVQLEVGSKASAFERRLYGMELDMCQRYYELVAVSAAIPSSSSTSNLVAPASFAATKRAIPIISLVTNNYLYASAGVTGSSSYIAKAEGVVAYRACSVGNQQQFSELIAASAEL
jgi:hypothetical protein